MKNYVMKSPFLLPAWLRLPGLLLLISGFIIGLPSLLWDFKFEFLDVKVPALWHDMKTEGPRLVKNNITDEIAAVMFIAGAVMVAFARLRTEDEYLARLRLDALTWATLFNQGVLILSLLFVYGGPFFLVMCVNLFSTFIVFLARFSYLLLRQKFRS